MTRHPITCERADELLPDWLEETLDRGTRAEMERHVAGCLRCTALVRDVENIREGAARLGPLEPSRDLWAGIAERIEDSVIARPRFGIAADSRALPPASRRNRWMARGLAAAALVGVTAGVTYQLTVSRMRGTAATSTVAAAPVTAASEQTPAPAPSVPSVATRAPVREASTPPTYESEPVRASLVRRDHVPAVTTYDMEIGRLRGVLSQRREDLDPATVAVLENSLKTIDKAVAEARQALANDPASRFLRDQLNKALEKKLGVLRTAALLPSRV
jgi:hypothetical protein